MHDGSCHNGGCMIVRTVDIAKELDVAQAQVSRIFNGVSRPGPKALLGIFILTGIDVDTLKAMGPWDLQKCIIDAMIAKYSELAQGNMFREKFTL